MIAIIDYGVGNIKAFTNIYHKLGVNVIIAQNADQLDGATKLILPGVGHFDYAIQRFSDSGMRQKASDMVVKQKIPVMGVCVGMQMLANSSEEGSEQGLGWIEATVKKFDESKISYKTHLPHMGWNDVNVVKDHSILEGLEENAKFYFLHSYYFDCANPENILAEANYGMKFSCIVNSENVYGVQCHPEKSHSYGIQLLDNFSKL